MALINGLRSNREKAKGACRLIERLFGGSCVRLENGTLLQGRVAAKYALLSGLHDATLHTVAMAILWFEEQQAQPCNLLSSCLKRKRE